MVLAILVLLAAPGDAPKATSATTVAEVTVETPDPAKMRKEAEEQTAAMRASLKRLLAMIEKARGMRDIVLLNCLNEKLTQMKALLRVGEQSNVNLQEFLAKEQIEGASHEKRKIGLAHDKVKSIVLESESCVSETGATGRTVVHVEKPDDVGDPTNLDGRNEGLDDLETLPSASPYN